MKLATIALTNILLMSVSTYCIAKETVIPQKATNIIELKADGFTYEVEGINKGGKKSAFAGAQVVYDSWIHRQWKEFRFPTGNEHFTRYWAKLHLINSTNGNVLNWHYIEAKTVYGCNADGNSSSWRHETRNNSSIGFGSGSSGPTRARVNGYHTFSTYVKFRDQFGAGYNLKVRPTSCP